MGWCQVDEDECDMGVLVTVLVVVVVDVLSADSAAAAEVDSRHFRLSRVLSA